MTIIRRFRRSQPVSPIRVARPTLGVDCTDIAPCAFTRAPFEFNKEVEAFHLSRARARVEDAPLSWFAQARSQADALGLAFGDDWRIDVLQSADKETVFLLTERTFGFRIVFRMRRFHYRGWCKHPDMATGHLPRWMPRSRAILSQNNREWLVSELYGNFAATESLPSMVRRLEAGASRAAADLYSAEDVAQVRALGEVLAEVWLAETDADAERRAAVRTMIMLGTPLSVCMGSGASPESRAGVAM